MRINLRNERFIVDHGLGHIALEERMTTGGPYLVAGAWNILILDNEAKE